MNKSQWKTFPLLFGLVLIANLSGCSIASKFDSFLNDKKTADYQNNASVKNLEFPPDLTSPEFDRDFDLPVLGTASVVSLRSGRIVAPRSGAGVSSARFPQSGVQRSRDLSNITTVAGRTMLQVNDTYARSLILTDIMLVRMGFTVVSKNPAGNVIFAQYNGADVASGEKISRVSSWLNRTKSIVGLGGSDGKALVSGNTYQFSISNQQGANLVSVAGASGESLSTAAHSKIITMLNNEFNR